MTNENPIPDTVSLAMTGASGACYGLRLLQLLAGAGRQVYFMISAPGRMCIAQEIGLKLPSKPTEIHRLLAGHLEIPAENFQVFGKEDWFAPACTSATLATIASGQGRNLIDRAADVTIKEQRKLILVIREMPFSAIHLENMLKLARLGVTIMPANPGFYQHPQAVSDLVDFVVARVLDHLKVAHRLLPPWGAND